MADILGYQFDRVFSLPIEKYRQVATIAERDNIPTGKRWRGMLCYVVSDDTDYQLRGGITNLDWIAASYGNYFELTNNDSDDIIEGVTNLFLDTIDKAKIDNITITQPVDLDALETTVNALGSGLTFKGTWDASSGAFPGGALTGYLYITSVAGTVDGVTFGIGDSLAALVDTPSTTVFASNWAKFDSVSDVTSVVGLTGAVSKAALLSALNVEDGATADMTGSEIAAAITAHLTTSDWQTKLTNEEVLDFIGAGINAGTQTNITVTYDDTNNKFDFAVTPLIQVYATLAALIAGQGTQTDDRLYEVTDASGFTGITSGSAWVRYKGTTLGTEADYIIVSTGDSGFVGGDFVDLTSPQTITGSKLIATGTNTLGLQVNSVSNGDGVVANNTGTGRGFWAFNNGSGIGIDIDQRGINGYGLFLESNLYGTGFYSSIGGTSRGLVLNGTADLSGNIFQIQSASVDQLTISKLGNLTTTGNVTANSFIKSGATNDDVLLGDGSTTSLAGISGGVGYSVYTALISQSGTAAPTAIVLENTLGGSIVWSRVGTGNYTGLLTGAFTADKTALFIGNTFVSYGFAIGRTTDNQVTISTVTAATGSAIDAALTKTSIEIRVYP